MNIATLLAGVCTLVGDIGGLRAEDGAGAFTLPGNALGKFVVTLVSITSMGTDEQREEYDPDVEIAEDTYEPDPLDPLARLGGMVVSATGNRQVTLQVKCETTRADIQAFPYCELVRNKLVLPSSGARLEALSAGIQRVGPTIGTPYDFDGRRISAALFELVLNASSLAVDEATTTIEVFDPELEVAP